MFMGNRSFIQGERFATVSYKPSSCLCSQPEFLLPTTESLRQKGRRSHSGGRVLRLKRQSRVVKEAQRHCTVTHYRSFFSLAHCSSVCPCNLPKYLVKSLAVLIVSSTWSQLKVSFLYNAICLAVVSAFRISRPFISQSANSSRCFERSWKSTSSLSFWSMSRKFCHILRREAGVRD